MSSAPRIGIPAIAGLGSLQDATRIGYSVDDNVARLLRYHWIEKRLSDIATARLTATPEWEVKGALALHQWLDAEHAQALRQRIREMRHPLPRLDVAPDPITEQRLAARIAFGDDRSEVAIGGQVGVDVAVRIVPEFVVPHKSLPS